MRVRLWIVWYMDAQTAARSIGAGTGSGICSYVVFTSKLCNGAGQAGLELPKTVAVLGDYSGRER